MLTSYNNKRRVVKKIFALNIIIVLSALTPLCFAIPFDSFLDTDERPENYKQLLVDLNLEVQKAINHLGFVTLALMNDLDDGIEFGYSDEWETVVGGSENASLACFTAGGLEVFIERTDYRKAAGSITANNCRSSLGLINGRTAFTYDDAVWNDDTSNPKVAHALKFKFSDVSIVAGDGETYTYSGDAFCDSQINHPLRTFVSEFNNEKNVWEATGFIYGRIAGKEYPNDYSTVTNMPTNNNNQILENVIIDSWNCDLVNVNVTVKSKTHLIESAKFESPDLIYGDDPGGYYRILSARAERLLQIGSGAKGYIPNNGGLFNHSEYGRFKVWAGNRNINYLGRHNDYNPSTDKSRVYTSVYESYSENVHNYWDFASGKPYPGNFDWALQDYDGDGSRENNYFSEMSIFELGSENSCEDWRAYRFESSIGPQYLFEEVRISYEKPTFKACDRANYFNFDIALNEIVFIDNDQDDVSDFYDLDDDNDGVNDALDAFPFDSSEQLDTDRDGIGNNSDKDDDNDGANDVIDAFPLDSTEDRDTDDDGIGNNADTDDDGDGYKDNIDAFPLDPLEHIDTDSDGLGNNKDDDDDDDGASDLVEIKFGSNPLIQDTDGDSMLDGYEISNGYNPIEADCPKFLCPKISPAILAIASSSFDFDRDGMTRAQEEAAGTDWQLADTDGDGLSDGDEINRSTNPLVADTDGDGLSDSDEIGRSTNPVVADSDGDGLNDGQEVSRATNPLVADSDGDTMPDGEEVAEGLDPNDTDDCPRWYCGGGIMHIIPAIVP